MSGRVESIFVTGQGGAAMERVDAIEALKGKGFKGDRYCTRRGYWTGIDECQVTLIAGEDLDAITEQLGVAVKDGEHRRNLVTREIALISLAGQLFQIGEAVFGFDRPRPPCAYIASLTERRMTKALWNRGGICARVVRAGAVRPGDAIEIVDAAAPELGGGPPDWNMR